MSRWVQWGGKLWGRGFFEPPPNLPAGVCGRCGGLGLVPEQIDEERHDVAVPCIACRRYCDVCRKWVETRGHECAPEEKR